MMRIPTLRERFLLAVAAFVVTLTLLMPQFERENPKVVEAVDEPRNAKAEKKSALRMAANDFGKELNPMRLRRPSEPGATKDAFSSRSWYVPPPPPPPPPKVEPPPPTAPPLPFSYIGRYVEAGVKIYFLARGERVLTVKDGDVLDGIYLVEGEEGSTLKFLYLPLNIRQTVDIGSAG